MQFCVRSFAITCGLFMAGTVAFVGAGSMAFSGYGQPVLDIFASLYPGYAATGTVADLLLGVVMALVDGMIGGFIFAWLYNRIAAR